MYRSFHHYLLPALLLGGLLACVACTPGPGTKTAQGNEAVSTPLTLALTNEGKWAIVDGQGKALYDVFIYDNGPDYPADGLIRVVKNGKIGYADASTYAIVIEPQFDCAFPFENGKAKVSNQCQTTSDGEHSVWTSDSWQYVDKQGQLR